MYQHHWCDVKMGMMASQNTSLTIVYLTIHSGADQRKHQSSASLAFVRGIHRWPVSSPHRWPVTRNMFSFNDVIIFRGCVSLYVSTAVCRVYPIKYAHGRYAHGDVFIWFFYCRFLFMLHICPYSSAQSHRCSPRHFEVTMNNIWSLGHFLLASLFCYLIITTN